MINFEQIKSELVQKGLCYESAASEATQKIVFIEGEWNRDGSAHIKSTKAGWIIGDFPKVLPVSFDVIATQGFDKSAILDAAQKMFSDAKIIVKIQ